MKYVYIEKENKFSKPKIVNEKYESPATRALEKKNRSELVALITEINRRTEENYHLNI